MNAEEGEGRIRHRVHEPVHERSRPFYEREVVTAERGDAIPTRVHAGQPRQPVRLHPGADHHLPGGNCVPGSEPHHAFVGVRLDCRHRAPEEQFATASPDVVCESVRYLLVIDDPGLRHVEGPNARDVRLDLPHLVATQLPQSGDPVSPAAERELVQTRDLVLVESDHELPGQPVRDAALLRVRDQELTAFTAERCLQRSRCVVETGVDHARVPPRLMPGDAGLLVDHADPRIRLLVRKRARDCESDDSGSDDHEIDTATGHSAALQARSRLPLPKAARSDRPTLSRTSIVGF